MPSTSNLVLKQHPSFYKDLPHTMVDRNPYTYLIGWSKLNMWYYGAQYGKGVHPSNLFNFDIKKPYLTSSSHVKQFIVENGLPDVIQIRQILKSVDKCRNFEERILKYYNARFNPIWLNKNNGNRKWDTTGTVVVFDIHCNKNICISKTDIRWTSGELKSQRVGKCAAIDLHGNKIETTTDDPRWKSGEIYGLTKGKFSAIDLNGNKIWADKNDPRRETGEIKSSIDVSKRTKDHHRHQKESRCKNYLFELISNIGAKYITNNLKEFTRIHLLDLSILRKYMNNGIIPTGRPSNKNQNRLNTTGWQIRNLKITQSSSLQEVDM